MLSKNNAKEGVKFQKEAIACNLRKEREFVEETGS